MESYCLMGKDFIFRRTKTFQKCIVEVVVQHCIYTLMPLNCTPKNG